jgi:hypothetical protein
MAKTSGAFQLAAAGSGTLWWTSTQAYKQVRGLKNVDTHFIQDHPGASDFKNLLQRDMHSNCQADLDSHLQPTPLTIIMSIKHSITCS